MYPLSMDDRCSDSGDSDCEDLPSLPKDPCYRCEKRVYPVERVDVGVLFHRRCFRCRVCGLQMTLKTFHWDQENHPDVYCSAHVTKIVGSIDKDAIGIKSALNAPRRGINTNEQVRTVTLVPVLTQRPVYNLIYFTVLSKYIFF